VHAAFLLDATCFDGFVEPSLERSDADTFEDGSCFALARVEADLLGERDDPVLAALAASDERLV
jgi:hypothetical protein